MCIPALRKKLAQPTILVPSREPVKPSPPVTEWSADSEVSCFASTGTVGVVDLGASQTVIGSQQVPELLANLPQHIRKQVKKTQCNLTFRFGNHQTLSSSVALIFPVHTTWFRVAIVPGKTPFLLSNAFLRTIQAVIDTEQGTLWSKYLGNFLETTKSSSGLMLLDLNQLWTHEVALCQERVPEPGSNMTPSSNRENTPEKPKQLQAGRQVRQSLIHVGLEEVCNNSSTNSNKKISMVRRVSHQCDLKLGVHLSASQAIMSSLSQKLNSYIQGVKKEDEKEEILQIEQMTLPQLQELKISFGKAKLGQSYEQAFRDQSWTKWFIQTYETSSKPEHRKFIRFVTLKLEEPMPSASKARPIRTKMESHLLSPSAQETGNAPAVTSEEMEDPWEIAEDDHVMKLYGASKRRTNV